MLAITQLPTRYVFTAVAGQTTFDVQCRIFDGYLDAFTVTVGGAVRTYDAEPGVLEFKTVQADAGAEGGQIILGAACAGGEQVIIERALPLERITYFPESGPVAMADVNAELTRIIALIQDAVQDGTLDGQLRTDLATIAGAALIGTSAGGNVQAVLNAILGNSVYVSWFAGATDADKLEAAWAALPAGGRLIFAPGGTTTLTRAVSLTGKNCTVIADDHNIVSAADGAYLSINGSISACLYLTSNYTKGGYSITVGHTGVQLADFKRNSWVKICSDALDGWNRNQGTQLNQYRLAEWARVRKVQDLGGGLATITFWNKLKFTRGFTNTGDAENLTEGDTYTTANNARIIALLQDDFEWNGGRFYVDQAATHIGAGGWDVRALLRLQGFAMPRINNARFGDGAGKGLELIGCPEFVVNDPIVGRLPDFAEQSANDAIVTTYLGYGIAIAGCWGGSVNDLVGFDCRHAITESNSTSQANSTTYGILLSIGRTYGTRINNPTVGGQYSSAIDCHHGAHAWIISNPTVHGVQANHCINVRGPNHIISGGQLTGERGILCLSEWDNDGGSDLPALVGNGNKWMSSVRVIGVNMDVTYEAVASQVGYVAMEGGGKIRSRTHQLFYANGGLIEFCAGRWEIEVTGENSQATVKGDTQPRGMFQGADVSSGYGATWQPGFLIREGAWVDIDASAAVDTQTIYLAHQDQTPSVSTKAELNIRGGLKVTYPAAGVANPPFGGTIYWTIDRATVFEQLGNAAILADYPKLDHGRVRISNLATGTYQRLFRLYDGLGGASGMTAIVELYVQDQNGAIAPYWGKYQINDSYAAASAVEATFLVQASNAILEAGSNVNLSTTAPTAGKIAFSWHDGSLYVRHDIAATIYEDVYADITINRQPLKP